MPFTSLRAPIFIGAPKEEFFRKVVDKVFAQLKKEGVIVSPVRCKWTPAE